MLFLRSKTRLVTAETALAGRADYAFTVPSTHAVLGTPLMPPFPAGLERAVFGLGCFWGAERLFWTTPGVWTTAVGYAGGFTTFPTYEEVCSARTGHAEVVLVAFDPAQVSFAQLLSVFFEGHDPTQGMRQGHDVGTQYRSAVYYSDESQRLRVVAAKTAYTARLAERRRPPATTEIAPAGPFFYAERYHQQYLATHPDGYCGLGGTGVSCPVGLFDASSQLAD